LTSKKKEADLVKKQKQLLKEKKHSLAKEYIELRDSLTDRKERYGKLSDFLTTQVSVFPQDGPNKVTPKMITRIVERLDDKKQKEEETAAVRQQIAEIAAEAAKLKEGRPKGSTNEAKDNHKKNEEKAKEKIT
jgi:hypothetical protein